MIVKIEDIGFVNKGAELMLIAIIEQLKLIYKNDLIIVVEPQVGNRIQKAQYDLFEEAVLQRFKIKVHKLFSNDYLSKYFLVKKEAIDLVLNASGFSFGDQWQTSTNSSRHKRRIADYKVYKKNGAKIIYLSQAFGPFKKEYSKASLLAIEPYVDLFIAREKVSYNYLDSLLKSNARTTDLKLFPDFTNLLQVEEKIELPVSDYFFIIPNYRMIDKFHIAYEAYLDFLAVIAEYASSKNLQVVLLNHEGNKDEKTLIDLKNKLAFKTSLYSNLDAKEVKYVIKHAYAGITSRFHGLVSALSQNIPVVCTSWSHKYELLLEDYDCSDHIVSIIEDVETVQNKLDQIIENNANIRKSLKEKAKIQKELTVKMWDVVLK